MYVQSLARLPGLIGGEFKMLETAQYVGKGNPGFQPRQRRSKAKVDAMAEGDVRIGIARDIEPGRFAELARISVCRAQHWKYQRARRYYLPVQFDVTARGAHHPL